jgi:MraZ protein
LDTTLPEDFQPLLGTDEATIDEKGRILFSKKKRERLGEHFTIALGSVGCLVAYPKSVWNSLVRNILSHDAINQGREHYTRLVLGLADDELKFDAQGRVVVPQKLRDLSQIKEKGQVLLVGCGDRVEIWSKDEYDKYQEYPDTYGQKRREALERAYRQMVGQS